MPRTLEPAHGLENQPDQEHDLTERQRPEDRRGNLADAAVGLGAGSRIEALPPSAASDRRRLISAMASSNATEVLACISMARAAPGVASWLSSLATCSSCHLHSSSIALSSMPRPLFPPGSMPLRSRFRRRHAGHQRRGADDDALFWGECPVTAQMSTTRGRLPPVKTPAAQEAGAARCKAEHRGEFPLARPLHMLRGPEWIHL